MMTADSAASACLPRSLATLGVGLTLAGLPLLAAPRTSALPSDVRDVIREQYVEPQKETRYLDAAIDLDADGQVEFVVHVAGGRACAAGGCPTLVFTHLASGFRLLSTIDNSAPPIRVGGETSKGLRNLIVRVADGTAMSRDVELEFDGRAYPADAAVFSRRAKTTTRTGRVIIAAVPFERMTLFAPAR